MRIALLTLTFVGLVFISGIIYTLVTKSMPGFVGQNIEKPGITESGNITALNATDKELIVKVTTLENRLDLLETGRIGGSKNTGSETNSEETQKTGTGIPEEFRKRIEPTIALKLIPNVNIFSLSGISYLPYSTYRDTQFGIIIYTINLPYEKFLAVMQTVPKTQYTLNEVKTFPFPAFYVNPAKADDRVRLVGKFSDQAVAIEMAKDKYSLLKNLLTRTDAPPIGVKTGSTNTSTQTPVKAPVKSNTPVKTSTTTKTGTTSTGSSGALLKVKIP